MLSFEKILRKMEIFFRKATTIEKKNANRRQLFMKTSVQKEEKFLKTICCLHTVILHYQLSLYIRNLNNSNLTV